MSNFLITEDDIIISHNLSAEDNNVLNVATASNDPNLMLSSMVAPYYKTMFWPKAVITAAYNNFLIDPNKTLNERNIFSKSIVDAYENSESPHNLMNIISLWLDSIENNIPDKVAQYRNIIPTEIDFSQELYRAPTEEESIFASSDEHIKAINKDIKLVVPVLNNTWIFSRLLYESSRKSDCPTDVYICRYTWVDSNEFEKKKEDTQIDKSMLINPIQELVKWEPLQEQLKSKFNGEVSYGRNGKLATITTVDNIKIWFYTVYFSSVILKDSVEAQFMAPLSVAVKVGKDVPEDTYNTIIETLNTIKLNYMINIKGHSLVMFPSEQEICV
jgi:hypothetical protein